MATTANRAEIGIALIGCGGMAHNYRDNYAHLPGTAYRLVVDVDAALAEQVARDLGVERHSTDWRDALAPDIHVADISTPNHLHEEQAAALLSAGKHVILQKPMAPSIAECRQIVDAATAAGRQAGVYMSDLEDPLVWDLRDLIRGGHIGQVSGVRARYAHRGGLRTSPSAWRGSEEKTGGGSFIQLSIHHTNLCSWLLDDQIASVSGYAKNLYCPNIGGDDTAVCVTEFARTGVLGVFESAWNSDGTCLEVYGTEGSLKMLGGQGAPVEARLSKPFEGRVLKVADPSAPAHFPASGNTRAHCRPDNPLNQHVGFVKAVQAGETFPVNAEIGLYDVAVVKALYRAAEEGRRVTVAEMLG